ncbi:YeeE/YedE family protein [Limibaculum sp. M0105]|uniref:YeeE/YedE family protein n=1 Tax=Thermohalobaculum xanthum TaxID=2753746 RepID=A0A8J7M7M8_9RHOB|nr:YeeE/YedE family protein [Thermohalobaculum xanthum]MBK0399715.1 YeeE/YedE family protein [Thermohalobaculum xanthum]
MQRNVLVISVAGLIALAVAAFLARGGWQGSGTTYAAGALLGGAAGFALYHASFGFTAAWRRMVRERRGAGLRAQTLLLALACTGTFLLIGYEDITGIDMRPVIMPMGVASAIGAVMFGIGMQIGGGCASGTLFTVGGGSTRMTIVLAFFIAGSVWATADIPGFWGQLDRITGVPNIPGTSLITLFGPWGGLAVLGAMLAAIWGASAAIERRAHGALEPDRASGSVLRGPWSMTRGAVALAIVSIGCFLVFQQPWGITSGFALWGAKILHAAGGDVASWPYWQGWRADQLAASVFADAVSIMNFGIVLGALAAAALAGRFAPVWHLSARDLLTAIAGGLLMGYGARLAYGCNIGAYLGGLVSGSMHGFWWLLWGFAGSVIGTRLRAALAMDPPLAARGAAA